MSSRQPASRNARFANYTSLFKLLAAAAPVVAMISLAGCDTSAHEADKKVQSQVAKAEMARDRGGENGDAEARKTLETAAAVKEASPMSRAYAKSSLAQLEQDAASDAMHRVDQDEIKLLQLVYEISQLGVQVNIGRAAAAEYAKCDPKPARDAIAAKIADAQGGPDKLVWFKQDNTSVPSLAAVKQTISRLDGEIAKKKDDLKGLTDQRTQTLDEAEQASKSSDASKAQQSVDEYKRASGLRKKAGDLSVEIEKNQAQTVPLEKDLAVAQGQQTVLMDAIKQLQDQSQALDAGWKSVQEAASSQSTLAQQIVAGNGAPPPTTAPSSSGAVSILSPTAGASLNAKATAMAKLINDIKAERTEAETNLNSAVSHFTDAAKDAKDLFTALNIKINDPANATRAELPAWKNLQAIANPAVFNLQAAVAQRQLAALYVSDVASIVNRQRMQDQTAKALTAAGVPVPPELAVADLDDQKKTAAGLAADAYTGADKGMANITEGAAPATVKDQAQLQHILTLYGQAQLARLTGDTAGATDKVQAAITERDAVIQKGQQLPPLPSEIAPAVTTPPPPAATPTATPAATPAAAPASAPALMNP